MFSKLKENPSVTRLIARYDHLPRRDQQALKLMVVGLGLALIYFAIWRPVHDYHEQAVSARDHATELLAWIDGLRATGLDGHDLAELGLKSGTLVVDDQRNGKRWAFEDINVSLTRSKKGAVSFTVTSDNKTRPWSFTASVVPSERMTIIVTAQMKAEARV